jgi:hypothetical protein
MDVEHVLHLHLEDQAQAQAVAEHFISANKLRGSSSGGSSTGLSPAALAHECYNTAYTLKVLASNMQLRAVAVVGGRGPHPRKDNDDSDDSDDSDEDEEAGMPLARHALPLATGVDVAQVARHLCVQGRAPQR